MLKCIFLMVLSICVELGAKKSVKGFALETGTRLTDKFEIVKKLGSGWEGEVYLIRELLTGIERAAKLFYPARNKDNKSAQVYAKKLHSLRQCQVLVKYITYDSCIVGSQRIHFLISEYIDGENLDQVIARQQQKRLNPYYAAHLLHSICRGVEEIHLAGEYHGDLHTGNVIIQSQGLIFRIKIIDFFKHQGRKKDNIQEDVINLVRVLYDLLGGRAAYSSAPNWAKDICCGLKRSLILQKFKTAGEMRLYLENLKM